MSIGDIGTSESRRIFGLVALLGLMPILLTVSPGLPNVFGSGYYSRLFDDFLIFAILAVALNIVFGHTDQLFLFLGGLAGVSAYTTAILADVFGVSAWLTLIVGMLLAGLIGTLVSWVAAKQKFNVVLISILTLNLQLALSQTFVGLRDITGGSTGRSFTGLGLTAVGDAVGVSAEMMLYYVLLVALLLALIFYVRLIDSKYGLAFDTIRSDELAAASIGVDVVRYKTINGFIGATMVGFAGVLFAQRQGYVLPPTFSFQSVDVIVLIVLIVGGIRTTYGPVFGAAIVIFLREALKRTVGEWETAVFGALLIALFLYFRSGVVPALQEAVGNLLGDDTEGGGETAD